MGECNHHLPIIVGVQLCTLYVLTQSSVVLQFILKKGTSVNQKKDLFSKNINPCLRMNLANSNEASVTGLGRG